MGKNIKILLRELYEIDPSFKHKETELVKIIEKLLACRPRPEMDAGFKRRLKKELLSRISNKKAQGARGFFGFDRRLVLGFGFGFASVAVLALIFVIAFSGGMQNIAQKGGSLDKPALTDDSKESEKKPEEPVPGESMSREIQTENKKSERTIKTETEPDKDKMVGLDEDSFEADNRLRSEKALSQDIGKSESAGSSTGKIESKGSYAEESGGETQGKSALSKEKEATESVIEAGESSYDRNAFIPATENPLSTFSIGADTDSYAFVRKAILEGRLPSPDAVRIEGLLNYFSYDYPEPASGKAFSVYTEASSCPWESGNKLVLIGIRGKSIEAGAATGAPSYAAEDMHFQVELNPAMIDSYRLIGYSNGTKPEEDPPNEAKRPYALLPGQTFTALYEIIPASKDAGGIALKQKTTTVNEKAASHEELLYLRLSFKKPGSKEVEIVERKVADSAIQFEDASENMRFASAVAEWGLLLSGSKTGGSEAIERIIELASGAKIRDKDGYKKEFLDLVEESAELLEPTQ